MITLYVFVVCLLSPTSAENDVIFASMHYHHQDLATRISCQMEEAQHFQYSSVTELWGAMGGQIALSAEVLLHCLGDDGGGKYGNEALKYRVEIANMQMAEEKDSELESQKKRKKRGVKDFFSNSWKKVKNFVNRIFGRKTQEPDVTRASNDDTDTVNDGEEKSLDVEPEEVFHMRDLEHLYSAPFQFVQMANGTIPEIRFSENEVEDGRVKNFKRHLVDAFSTQLNFNRKKEAVVEQSVMGEHTSNYNITVTGEKSANLNIAGWGSTTEQYQSRSMVVVEKMVTADDIVKLAPSDAFNDKNRMDLKTQQMQVFKDGRMISSSGISSLLLVADNMTLKNRNKRDADEDATSYIHTHTAFDIQLRRRRRRSAAESVLHQREENTSFRPSSRAAEVDDSQQRRKLQDLQESADMKLILEDLISGEGNNRDQKMQTLFEIVDQEVSLKLDEETNSISNTIRRIFTIEKMDDFCSRNFSSCKDYLQLVALAGGSEAEQVFLHLLRNISGCPVSDIQAIADILSDIPHPSDSLLTTLGNMLEGKNLLPEMMGALCISISNLASKREEEKERISDIFAKMLVERQKGCREDPILIDLLEAVGNLKCDRIIPRVLQVSADCGDNSAIQIACAHALRHSSHVASVQEWIENTVHKGDCDVIKEVVGSLMDKIQDQEMTPDLELWPRFHFNKIDALLQNHLVNYKCSMEDILLYFRRKRNAESNAIAGNHFGPESEPWEPRSNARQKRRTPWEDLNCQEWTEDTKYRPIQDKDEFESDRATYNKRKSCLAFRKLGVKGANAEIYAGMFAGVKEPSDPPKYKLFTKFVSGVNFLGHQVEIGSFYFYLQSGKTKAYVRIMGQTRQEFTNDGCTPTELRYRPLKHIPLYLVSIANVQMSLGVHLSSKLSLDTVCPENDIYQLQPLIGVRIGGEALGTVLFVRGAADLGADFNYKLQFTFTPTPDMCLKGSHGFDPMTINFESYYQLWNAAKQDWGKTRVWKPSFLSWEIRKSELKQWFDDTCVASPSQNKDSSSSIERELE